jgi:hypothetical protein
MKKFMLIFLGEDYSTIGLSPEEMQQRMGKWFAWGDKMKAADVLVDGHALESQTVRHVSGPDRTVTDRAGSEIKELVGGYYIVTAADLDGAMEIAADYPDYDLGGTVEIRQVMVFG